MKKRTIKEYYLGLDIGTNSVGYAVTDPQYKILKYHGEPMWGSHVFEEGSQCAERRGFRTARRRLNRRQQRVRFVQEIFAHEIEKVDSRFFLRIKESALYREDANGNDPFILFNDNGYTDKEYYLKYPTIHHLIMDLIDDENPHDVRLVYLAVAWLVAHRGHFLSDVEKTNVEKVLDFSTSYNAFKEMYHSIGQDIPWVDEEETFKNILLKRCGVKDKEKAFKDELFKNNSNKKTFEGTEENDILGTNAVITLLSGGTVTADKLFVQAEFQDKISISFKKNEDEFEQILTELDEYAEYLLKIRAVYDWAVLYEASQGQVYISKAKIEVYEQHKKDLAGLKAFIRKYCPDKYNEIFRDAGDNNYVAYSYNFNSLNLDEGEKRPKRKASQEDFCTYIRKIVKDIKCEMEDKEFYEDMGKRLELGTFMPKQVNTDNRVIPYQLYYFELARLLEKVSSYLPFINEKDSEGYITKEKLLSIMEFRIPYYVGPLHRDHKENNSFAWIKRKAQGRIYPWNYEEKIDLDASEQAFIDKMTNQCSYLPGEDVLPKYSLLYCKYEVLNEINNIKINGQKITVDCKKGIFGLFKRNKKVTVKKIRDFLVSNNYMSDSDEICGNVYHSTFTKKFFLKHQTYSIKTETVYKRKIEVDGKLIWNGQESLSFVIKMLGKNNIHYTRYAFCRKGGFFDQMPVTAKEGLVSRKKNLPSEKYGGYNKPAASYFIMAKYTEKVMKEKQDIMIVPVELMVGEKVLNDKNFAVGYIQQQIAQISNRKVEEIINVSFPLGLRPLKVNTRFSFDGFEACVTGKANGGKILGISSLVALKMDNKKDNYIKKIEKYIEKRKLNINIKLDEKYDGINYESNQMIYNILVEKIQCSIYKTMFGSLVEGLENAKSIFEQLSLEEQCLCINSLINVFKTGRSSGCDLTLIGGKKQAAVCTVSSKVSNWKKNYTCVKIIDESASGIFRKESENILEWL